MKDPSPRPVTAAELNAWLAAARQGSKDDLGRLLEACRPYLLQVADRTLDPDLRAKAGASDLVQQSFLEAQQHFDRFRGATEEEWRAWLGRILLNNMANFTRQYRGTEKRQIGREVPLDGPQGLGAGQEPAAEMLSPSGEAMVREQAEAVERAFRRLPEQYRAVLQLRQRDQHAFEEIGKMLDCTPDAARKLWARAVERLRQEIGGLDERP
jgi:RNA polymerase sigma-70 factor (ECF subfamily)